MVPSVLIVESDLLVRMPLAEYLRSCGYHVVEAASAEEARELLDSWPQHITAALIDLDKSEDVATRLAAWIRRRHPQVEVSLAATPGEAADNARSVCDCGPAVVKPYEHRLVMDRIRQLLAARNRQRSA